MRTPQTQRPPPPAPGYHPHSHQANSYKQTRSKVRKILIKLNERDLYEIEIGYIAKPSLEWVIKERVSNVSGVSLTDAIRRVVAKAEGLDT
jgi:hypothetical protein